MSALLVGCGSEGEDRPAHSNGFGQGDTPFRPPASSDETGKPCDDEGAEKACSIIIEQASGVVSCWQGTRVCEDGRWSACWTRQDVARSSGAKEAAFRPRAASLSLPQSCGNDCDPSCRYFDEDPPDLVVDGGGTPPSDPPDFEAPPGRASCSHELCSTGSALDSGCHPCVAEVCADMPECCSSSWSAACVSQALAVCPASPNVRAPSSPCDGVPAWAEGTYAAGARVVRGGTLYACNGHPYTGWCGLSAYAPPSQAWTAVESCAVAPACAISLDLPEVPPWNNEPCRSGLDCQVNHRCTDVHTQGTCRHSKCIEGTGLRGSCDPCVERVCAADPSCCTDDGDPNTFEWDAACVALVKSECDADCGDSTGAVCGHQLCATGGALERECDPCVEAVCDSPGFGFCCTSGWSEFCVEQVGRVCRELPPTSPPRPGTSRCDYALMGSGALAIYSARVIGGDVGGGTGSNRVSADASAIRPYLSGSIYSQGSMDIFHSDIAGDAIAAGTLAGCSDLVAGDCENGLIPAASVPSRSFSCDSGSTSITTATTLPPGSYGEVSVAAGQRLRLQAGPYRMASLTLGAGAILELPSTGTVYLDLCGALSFGSNVTFAGVTQATDAFRFRVYAGGAITIGSSSVVYGIYTAPNSQATVENGSAAQWTRLYGLLHVAAANLYSRSEINSSGLTGQACRDQDIDDPPLTECPVVIGSERPPAGLGLCVKNALGYEDPGCAGIDLALDVGCEDTITVCNHGGTDAPSGATLAFYAREGQQFATDTPDENWRAGSCVVESAVPAGGCVRQACDPALLADDLFVFVNPSDASPLVSECSRLDNWTMHDASVACLPGNPTRFTYEYEATCPTDSVPLWGLLTWRTSTPGSSRVEFSGRVGHSAAELSGQSWLPLGTASRVGVDTQVCSQFPQGGSCAVDLTERLALGRSQPHLLELDVWLYPEGTSSPTVRSWEITYSCVVDQ